MICEPKPADKPRQQPDCPCEERRKNVALREQIDEEQAEFQRWQEEHRQYLRQSP